MSPEAWVKASAIGSAIAAVASLAVAIIMGLQYWGERADRRETKAARKWASDIRKNLFRSQTLLRGTGVAGEEVSEHDLDKAMWAVEHGYVEFVRGGERGSVKVRLIDPNRPG